MQRLFRASDDPCPDKLIAVAINPHKAHVGIVYPRDGDVRLCDFQNERQLAERPLPSNYYWAAVDLEDDEVRMVTSLVKQIYRLHPNDLPYSLQYTPSAFDTEGRVSKSGAGFTCATFIVGVFEALEIPFVDLDTWEARPAEDEAFRDSFLNQPLPQPVVDRIKKESIAFRIKPTEICGSACSRPYPIDFTAAKAAAVVVTQAIDECEAARATG